MRCRVLACLVLGCALLGMAQEPATPNATASPSATTTFVISGTVLSGKIPLPGVNISAANSLTGKKIVTSTNTDGHFEMVVPGRGKYVVRAELTAFAAATSEVVTNPTTPQQEVELEMVLLSKVPKDNGNGGAAAQLAGALLGRGPQTLSVSNGDVMAPDAAGGNANGGGNDAPLPGMNALANTADASNQSVSVTGQMGNTQDFGLRNMDDLRDRIEEMRARGELPQGGAVFLGGPGGGFPGGGGGGTFILGGPGALGGGGRNGRGGFNINKPHGNFYYSMGNAALDAAPYALNGPVDKPDYSSNRFGGSIGGPLNIPHIYQGGTKTMFFGSYTGTRATTPYQVFSHVPTEAQRAGDFSGTTYTSGPNAGQQVQLFDPFTGLPILNNNISSMINPTAGCSATVSNCFLNYIPLPNLNPNSPQNFRFTDSADTTSDALSFRIIHNFGQAPTQGARNGQGGGRGAGGGGRGGRRARNNINFGFNWQRSGGDQLRPFPTVHGTNSMQGFAWNTGYTVSRGKLNTNLRLSFNSQQMTVSNIFAGVTNVAQQLNITGTSPNAEDWGVPGLAFSNFSGLNDVMPQSRHDRTLQASDTIFWGKGKHNIRFGGDYRRLWSDVHSSSNPNGTFTFTGLATAQKVSSNQCPSGVTPPCLVAEGGTGYDFADFLLGLPQQTTIQYSQFTYNLYANAYNAYVQDDWRARSNLTFDLGLRYEYLSPYHEANNRLVNLDPAPGFTAVAPVLPGQVGPYGGFYPSTLVEPDRNNFAPRIGVAWKPFGNKTVIRGGYGINYNLGQYRSMVLQLVYQPPFSTTQTISATNFPVGTLTFQNAFPTSPQSTVTNNYAVDKNYRLGYVQMWNLNIQHELKPSLLLNIGYTGSKGTALDMVRAPNRGPDGVLLIPNVQPFLFETSQGSSILHAGTISFRKRMTNGMSAGGTYTYSKSIDNASSIGGGAVVVAQNDLDLAAERGLSSFDQRHKLSANFYYDLPFGAGRHWVTNPGVIQKMIGDWTWSGDVTLASGVPFTARIIGDFASVAQGTSGSLRANYNGQPISLSNPTAALWFNTAAFSVPSPGTFGDAGRNTIEGPGTILVDFALAKNFPIKDAMAFEVRAQASNVFNHPNFSGIDTTVNSPTFGQVISIGSMRTMQIFTRFRF